MSLNGAGRFTLYVRLGVSRMSSLSSKPQVPGEYVFSSESPFIDARCVLLNNRKPNQLTPSNMLSPGASLLHLVV